jgi:hypothetical protein
MRRVRMIDEPQPNINMRKQKFFRPHIYYFMLPNEISYRISLTPTLGTYKIEGKKRIRYSIKSALQEIIIAINDLTINKIVMAVDSNFQGNDNKMAIIERIVNLVRLRDIAPRKVYLEAIYGMRSLTTTDTARISTIDSLNSLEKLSPEDFGDGVLDINEIAAEAISVSLRKLNPEYDAEVRRHKTDDEMLGKYAKADISTLLTPPDEVKEKSEEEKCDSEK